ncbi:MAG: class IV adenylate cyclase [Patescibacteria group bacterium]|nr:class IV adenylate cyclase [Patescibacteria group bacterium]MDD5164260.1 class IV adenylate cyclase [Patescibacteria group bacterium]MDD5535060.1 class IV adenylate cyclase [Patescibacteria group bacterium]
MNSINNPELKQNIPVQEKIKKLPKEIERKFFISSLPENLEDFPHEEVMQGYIALAEDGTEIRLRKRGDKYFQTVKNGAGKIRTELEIEITEEQFNALWITTEGKRLEKIRYKIPYEAGVIELDVYQGNLKGLVTAEMEFKSEKDSDKFIPPQWFGEEATNNEKYKNQYLAIHGLPENKKILQETKEVSNIPEYDLEQGVGKLSSLINEKLSQQTNPVIVEIAGGSASGKTSAVAKKVKELFDDKALIFSMDDYYRGKKFMDKEAEKGNILNWDQPEALNLELLKEHLQKLEQGKSIQKPIYNFKEAESTGTEEVQPNKVVIVEGLFALNESIAPEGDIKAFVDIGTHGRILRRLLRDVERTGQKPIDILKYFSEVVEPMHEKHIQNTKKNADIIIKNEYSPKIEAQKSGLHEIQLKFSAEIDPEFLRKMGAERLGSTTQTDYYYNPKDRNLIETDEVLRIRDEGEYKILTYKGPRIESDFRERPKFEFEIDAETEKKFLSVYGDKIKTIKKERVLYQLGGVIFSVDSVAKIEDGKKINLGKFVEIRSTDKETNEKEIKETISKLGFSLDDSIKKSYFEM